MITVQARLLCRLSFALLCAFIATEAYGEEARPFMNAVDYLSLERLETFAVSPDGSQAIVERVRTDWREDESVSSYFHFARDNGKFTNLSALDDADAVVWSPDGRLLAVDQLAEAGEEKRDQIHVLDPATSTIRQLTHHATSVSQLQWSSDGEWIYFLAAEELTSEEKRRRKQERYVKPYYETTDFKHLWRVGVATGAEEKLTSGDFTVRWYDVAAGGALLVRRAPGRTLDDNYESELWLADAVGGDFRQLTENDYPERNAQLSPDGSKVAYTARADLKGAAYVQSRLFILDLESGETYIPTKGEVYDIDGVTWLASGDGLVLSANAGARSGLLHLDLCSGKLEIVSLEDRRLLSWDYAPAENAVYAIFATAQSNGDVWKVSLMDGAEERVTRFGEQIVSEFALPEQRLVRWRSVDGQIIEGFYFPPQNDVLGDPAPLVVQLHGGPRSSDQYGMWSDSRYPPVLTGVGYGVLWVNYRGGVGYGDAFMRGMHKSYFAIAQEDVLSGVDALVALGVADPDRLTVMGWSAGAHMTNALVTQTDRFKAAVSGAGAVDWATHHLSSDTRGVRRLLFDAEAWNADDLKNVFWKQSLLPELEKIKTPMLIMVGEKDERVHSSQSIMLFHALRNLGVETKLFLFPDEPHGLKRPTHKLFRVNMELEWFASHIGAPVYEWTPIPEAGIDGAISDEESSHTQTLQSAASSD